MMLFLVAGILKPCSADQVLSLQGEFNEHLAQPFRRIALAGELRDKGGDKIGYLAFVEARDFTDAETYLHQSPFYQNELYERVQVAEFNAEVGWIE